MERDQIGRLKRKCIDNSEKGRNMLGIDHFNEIARDRVKFWGKFVLQRWPLKLYCKKLNVLLILTSKPTTFFSENCFAEFRTNFDG